MKNEEFYERIESVLQQVRASSDALLVCHFGSDQDQFHMKQINMDPGDALIVIKHLAKSFRLNPQAIAIALSEVEAA